MQFKTGKDRVHAIKVNVIDRVAMAAAADEIEAKFGKIHLISNNAGIGPLTPLSATEPKDFDQTVAVNLTGVYNGVHIFLPRIRKHGEGGHIVTTSSMSGILPTEGGGAGAYTCTKFATVGMMEILRSELDTANANVGVSVYCPGLVNTNIFELAKNVNAAFTEPGAKAGPADAPVNEAFIRQIIGNGMDPMEAGPHRAGGHPQQRHVDTVASGIRPWPQGTVGRVAGIAAQHQGAANAPGAGNHDHAQLAVPARAEEAQPRAAPAARSRGLGREIDEGLRTAAGDAGLDVEQFAQQRRLDHVRRRADGQQSVLHAVPRCSWRVAAQC